ncbi:IS5 family transposase [Nocardia salmonicida]|uniref:IS5 family transposase n=1 Tax=Nocardia salmonicida TaxID=53431 RepID=UPI0036267BB1
MDDQLWAVIEPLLPVKAPGTPGPARMNNRLVLQGILFVLITGIGWEDLRQELGFGSGMTCWRRLRDWQGAGVFEAMHTTMLAHCHRTGTGRFRPRHPRRLARTGQKRGTDTGPSPVDRRKTGAKHHILTCGNGLPLAIVQSAANVNDHLMLPELLDRVRPLRDVPADHARRSRP